MQELDAINYLLRLIGTRAVTSVTVGHPDVVDAKAMLSDWIKKCLDRGWWFNRMHNVELVPNSDKNIVFGLNVIRFEYPDRQTQLNFPMLSKRGSRLLNVKTNSYVFEDTIRLNLYIDLTWDDLPHTAKQYVLYSAGAEYVRDKIEDIRKETSIQARADEQYAELNAEEMRQERYNMFDAPATADVRRGRRPFLGTGRLR